MGGLATLILGFWFPNTFTRIAALSPSVWWDDSVIHRIVEEIDEAPRSSKIWLDIGTPEEGWERVGHLRDQLIERGWRLHNDLHYKEVQDAEHSEWAGSARFEAVLRFLFLTFRRSKQLGSESPSSLPDGLPNHVDAPIVTLRQIRHQAGAAIST